MYRIGQGYDRHRLAPARKLVIGGVVIDSEFGTVSHSDGDVLLHAVVNALLGAIGEGDIGLHFSDRDERLRGADSATFVSDAMERVKRAGFRVVNLDATVLAEKPRLAPFRQAMETRIAELVEVDPEAVNVKFGTGEGIGTVGRGAAVEAQVVVLLTRTTDAGQKPDPRRSS